MFDLKIQWVFSWCCFIVICLLCFLGELGKITIRKAKVTVKSSWLLWRCTYGFEDIEEIYYKFACYSELCTVLLHMFDQCRLLFIFSYRNSTWIHSYINANITDKEVFWPPPTQILVSLFLRSDRCQTFLFIYISQGESNCRESLCSILH